MIVLTTVQASFAVGNHVSGGHGGLSRPEGMLSFRAATVTERSLRPLHNCRGSLNRLVLGLHDERLGVFHCIVGGSFEQRPGGLGAADVAQAVDRLAHARVAAL